jgi:hypothetical protein
MSRLLLKARPTNTQLADRLADPPPDGLELYLDAVDLCTDAAIEQVVANVEGLNLPSDFDLLIEGPVRSLDGEFFETSRDAEADREVVRRLARLAGRLGARAVNVHLIAPTEELPRLTIDERATLLERALSLTRLFVDQVRAAGAVPTIENMPPILRMRESGFYYSPVGMPAEDLIWLCDRVPGLRTTLDLSHAGLYVNCQRHARASGAELAEPGVPPALFAFARQLRPVRSVHEYAEQLGSTILTCHVANAAGLLGEGAPYDRGELDLDGLVRSLSRRAEYFVTETLESDPNRALEMRRALVAMRRALQVAA